MYTRVYTRKEGTLLHGLSSRLNDVEKRVERAKGSGETRHEDGRIVVEEKRTRKDRLSRSRKRGGRREKKKKGKGGGEEKKNKGKKAVLRSPHEDLPTQDHDKITLQNPPCERIILPLCTAPVPFDPPRVLGFLFYIKRGPRLSGTRSQAVATYAFRPDF